ncbi:sialic acid-binding Ig-like lectin 8 [Cetorhinus maximus]
MLVVVCGVAQFVKRNRDNLVPMESPSIFLIPDLKVWMPAQPCRSMLGGSLKVLHSQCKLTDLYLFLGAPQNLSITSPDMIKDSSISIIEGNSTVIICSVECFPVSNLTWRHLNVPMNRTSSNNELWLVIPHVTPRDTGDYQCVAENEHVAVEGFITITVERRDSSKWTVGLVTAGSMLSVFLVGIFIFICVIKRKTVTEERDSGTSDVALTPSPLSVKHQGKQNVLITQPRDTTRDTARDGVTPALRDLSEGAVGGESGHWHTDNPDALLYANPLVFRVPSGDGSVHMEVETEYAQIRRKTATEERVSGTSDIALTPSPLSVKHQGKQNVLIAEPRDTTRDTTFEGVTPAIRDLSEGAVGVDAGHGNPDNPDDLLYANPHVFRVPSGDRTVHREEETEYAQIRFKRN